MCREDKIKTAIFQIPPHAVCAERKNPRTLRNRESLRENGKPEKWQRVVIIVVAVILLLVAVSCALVFGMWGGFKKNVDKTISAYRMI